MAAAFDTGDTYELLMGRWSESVATRFVRWLAITPSSRVLDVGCGTGALSRVLLTQGFGRVVGVDPSASFIAFAGSRTPNATFQVGEADALRFPEGSFDAVVSGLVLNFLPDAPKGVREMVRVVKKGGTVAAYVWDYPEKMEYLQLFWEAARSVDPAAETLDEGKRFSICRPEKLRDLFEKAGLETVSSGSIDLDMTFRGFDECWAPFLGGQGPSGSYLASLGIEKRQQLKSVFRRKLPVSPGGELRLQARACTVKGVRPGD